MAPSRFAACSLAFGACGFASQAFLSPGPGANVQQPSSGQGPALRGVSAGTPASGVQQGSSCSISGAAVSSVAVLGCVAAAVSRSNKKAPKTIRNFFDFGSSGSSSPAYKPWTIESELGVQEPIGFWDPAGLSKDMDEAAFKRRRAVEIKHGRVSMYACIGYIVPEYFKFPGYLSPSQGIKFSDVPNGLAALSKVPVLGGAQIVAFAGLIETTGFFQATSTTDGRGSRGEGTFLMSDSTESGEPGNYGVGFPNFVGKIEDPEERRTKLAAELANGRLAMMAIIGMFFQDGLTGSAWGDWALYTGSPLR